MLRTPASRAVLRSLTTTSSQTTRFTYNGAFQRTQFASQLCTLSSKRPQLLRSSSKTVGPALLRRQITQTKWDKPDLSREEKIGEKKLESHPELVSATSSIHPVFGEVGTKDPPKEADMMAGIKADLVTIKDTFSLKEVPREAIVLGLAGILPYAATSMSTVYCAWEIHNFHTAGSGFLMSGQTAEALLHILEPLQVGYGAVIISFLGAIHWGLEWAGYGGKQGYSRYMIGVMAPAVAWPTTMLPIEYALISQFLAFNFLYYADSRAAVRGWAPAWYSTYRFMLTFFVGASIVLTLIGRSEVGDKMSHNTAASDRVKALRELQPGTEEGVSKDEEAKVEKEDDDDEE